MTACFPAGPQSVVRHTPARGYAATVLGVLGLHEGPLTTRGP